ncbi:hypothetical protein C4K25_2342 [Pseudomonas chlororaphis]|nr:hypothetical protein C4K25_2342 [Pseudomonas chlororaphis]
MHGSRNYREPARFYTYTYTYTYTYRCRRQRQDTDSDATLAPTVEQQKQSL